MQIKKTDSEIQQAVLQELRWDTRVQATEVGVEVDRGVVTLTGTVANWAKRIAAQEAAHRVAGVLDVANDVAVRFPGDAGRTDTDIAAAVRHALEWDVLVPHERIRSTFSAGWVSLEGDVDFWSTREDVEKCIRNLNGVHGVTNSIKIKHVSACADDVRRSIEAALERQAEHKASGITVRAQHLPRRLHQLGRDVGIVCILVGIGRGCGRFGIGSLGNLRLAYRPQGADRRPAPLGPWRGCGCCL